MAARKCDEDSGGVYLVPARQLSSSSRDWGCLVGDLADRLEATFHRLEATRGLQSCACGASRTFTGVRGSDVPKLESSPIWTGGKFQKT